LWDAETGKETRCFRRERSDADETGSVSFTGVAITPNGKTLIAMENHDIVHVWDLTSGKERWQLKGGNGFALALSADGKTMAKGLGGDDEKQQVSLWDLETGKLIRTLGATNRSVHGLAFSRDGKLLAAGDGYPRVKLNEKADTASSVRLWDPTRMRIKGTFLNAIKIRRKALWHNMLRHRTMRIIPYAIRK
jgi:WD40 repeat protein